MRNYVSENAMLDDLTEILGDFVFWLGNVFGIGEPAESDMQYRPNEPVLLVNGPANRFGHEDDVPLDISQLPITVVLRKIRSYAFDGIRPTNESELLDDLINAQEFLFALKAADESGETHEFPSVVGGAVDRVVMTASARFTLDAGDPLSIPLVAALAGLDERTVRNLASKSGDESLTTFKVDGHTRIDADVAYEWLVNKKGFTPTRGHPDSRTSEKDFGTVAEFGEFLRERRELLGLSIKDVVQKAKSPGLTTKSWSWIENSGYLDRLSFVPGISAALDLDESEFTKRVMQVHFKRQWDVINDEGEER